MPIEQYTYWSVTINNPDENDFLIVRTPNDKYLKHLVWSLEKGEKEETPHIQAWVRLQRNQSMAFMKKLYPRGHFKHCDKDEYNENTFRYAQKEDATTVGAHVHVINDPLPANDTLLYKVLQRSFERMLEREPKYKDHYQSGGIDDILQRIHLKQLWCDIIEREMIMERSGYEKIFISPAYEKMKDKYWKEILLRIYHKQNVQGQDFQSKEKCDASTQTDEEESDSVSESGSSSYADIDEGVGGGSSEEDSSSWC